MQEDKTKKKKTDEKKRTDPASIREVSSPTHHKRTIGNHCKNMTKYDRTCAFKPGTKHKSDPMKMADVVYKVQCKHCPCSYTGETT